MQSDIQHLVGRVRNAILSRGQASIRGLARTFRKMDSYNDNKVDRDEFFIGLKETGVSLTKQECYVLHSYFDTNHDGSVDFNEFLVAIRGQLNERRHAVVAEVFSKFQTDASGTIEVRDLRGVYNCSRHPKVLNGQMTQEQVFLEFLQNFVQNSKEGRITFQEWSDYYSAVSVSIESDDHFEALIRNAWGVN